MTRTRSAAAWAGAIAFGALAIFALGAVPGRVLTGQPAPAVGTFQVRGISDLVTVIRDSVGVPHIFAASPRDALFGLGFVHAQDRRLQMELVRRAGRGESASLSGIGGLPGDRMMRTLGVWRVAREEAALLSSSDRELHEGYAAGVNAAAQLADWPTGMLARMLQVRNEPWTVSDSILVLKLATLGYATQHREELLTAALARHAGTQLRWFVTKEPVERAVILAEFPYLAALQDINRLIPATAAGAGSNAWAVHGTRTSTGRPLLASDPHMAFSAPSGIYAAHLSTPGLEVMGVGIPGLPGFFHGHNDRIAWGITVVGADAEDLYLEELSGPQDETVRRPGGSYEKLEAHTETIVVRNDRPVTHRVRRSTHGALISDAMPSLLDAPVDRRSVKHYALALAATALRPAPPGWYLRVMRARNWSDFRAALSRYSGPAFNFIYADAEGHIGYQMAGVLPVRYHAPPEVPYPGWETSAGWKGEVPFASLPSVVDPAQGWVATGNARTTRPEYPVYISNRWGDLSWRVARVRDLLRGTPRAAVDQMAAMQLDLHQESMKHTSSWIQGGDSTDTAERRAIDMVARWDHRATLESVEQPLGEAFRMELAREVFGQRLPAPLFEVYLAMPTFVWPALEAVMDDSAASFFGPDPPAARKARQRTVARALRSARNGLAKRFGKTSPAWEEVHTLTFRSPFVQGNSWLPRMLARSLNVGPFAMAGSTTTVQAAAWQPSGWFSVTHGSGYRQIVDLSDLSASRYLPPPPGQSEHAGSRFYSNLAGPLVQGRYFPMLWTRARIEADASSTLTLRP